MPNWCMNSLQITGSAEQIKEIEAKLEESGGKEFFDIFVKNAKDAGHEDDWYSYNQEQYGCKWNCDASSWDTDSGDGTTITISFDSPWGPPSAIFEKIQETPGLSVYAQYHEPGMCFVGEYNDGSEDSYDYSDCTSETIYESVPAELVDSWGIAEQMAEYEAENDEE
jgi:hypothetical protein